MTTIKKWRIPGIISLISLALFTCIDPYTPQLNDFKSSLVVDALITDEDRSTYVRLSRTIQVADEEPVRVTGALVSVSDNLDNVVVLTETSPGSYLIDSLSFRGEVGRSYTLHIRTPDGRSYESAPCMMYPVPGIDSIWINADKEFSEETGNFNDGISFYLGVNDVGQPAYYRWEFEEWWKFKVPNPAEGIYKNKDNIIPIDELKQTCYANVRHDVIDLNYSVPGDRLEKKPVMFVASGLTDRLRIQYCLVVRQMSLSADEYDFWRLMSEIRNAGGDIFDKQPFQVFSNIRSLDDPDELVMGYFQVSAVETKRMYVTHSDISDLGIPIYWYTCNMRDLIPEDIIKEVPGQPFGYDDLVDYMRGFGYEYVTYRPNETGGVSSIVFALKECTDCTLRGDLKKPWFWVDII